MQKRARVCSPLHSLLPTQIKGFDSLAELALDYTGWATAHIYATPCDDLKKFFLTTANSKPLY